MKEKILSILFMFIIGVPTPLVLSYLHFQKKHIKHEVKTLMLKGMQKDKLVFLNFSIKEINTLKWEKQNEFEFGGEMYDVVKKEIKGDSISYWCWWDKEETELNKKRSEYITEILGNDKKRNERQNQLLNFFKQLYFEEIEYKPKSYCNHLNVISYQDKIYLAPCISREYPPPI